MAWVAVITRNPLAYCSRAAALPSRAFGAFLPSSTPVLSLRPLLSLHLRLPITLRLAALQVFRSFCLRWYRRFPWASSCGFSTSSWWFWDSYSLSAQLRDCGQRFSRSELTRAHSSSNRIAPRALKIRRLRAFVLTLGDNTARYRLRSR